MESKDAVLGFAALAQETRLDLMRLLAARGASGMAAGELAAALGLPPSTLSFHLAALEQAQLVQSVRRGRHLIYSVRFFGLRSLFGFLTETCCGGRPQLCGDLARLLPDDPPEDKSMTAVFNVLFLCTHNSARSLMAQAILEKVGRGRFNAYSAGSHPARTPMPEVITRLKTLGHDVSGLHCKSWNAFAGPDAPRMDFVITLCDTIEGQDCPDVGDKPITAAWPLPDPAKFKGTPAERATMINELYGMIRRRLEIFVNLPYASLDRMALRKRLDEIGDSTRAPA
jgi:ArsR family transcriptional regulator, arsenate/arsenite/antimonite-responsive transcriptional repressor / arsenate reductase (thioredoxin)